MEHCFGTQLATSETNDLTSRVKGNDCGDEIEHSSAIIL